MRECRRIRFRVVSKLIQGHKKNITLVLLEKDVFNVAFVAHNIEKMTIQPIAQIKFFLLAREEQRHYSSRATNIYHYSSRLLRHFMLKWSSPARE